MNTPRTDAKLVELDMQDLEFGHKYQEVVRWAKELEVELANFQRHDSDWVSSEHNERNTNIMFHQNE